MVSLGWIHLAIKHNCGICYMLVRVILPAGLRMQRWILIMLILLADMYKIYLQHTDHQQHIWPGWCFYHIFYARKLLLRWSQRRLLCLGLD